MIGIINYGMGNLRSVQKAFERVGVGASILNEPGEIAAAKIERLVLPGVGAFRDAMAQLNSAGWVEPIGEFVKSGRPMLGICLGMQLMFEASEEGGEEIAGLGFFEGKVTAFEGDAFGVRDDRAGLKVPHMGWNSLSFDAARGDKLLTGLEPGDGCAVYFVHGYHAQADSRDASALCDYGGPFCATAWRDNLYATQFHPEKSQRVGLAMLDNFARRV